MREADEPRADASDDRSWDATARVVDAAGSDDERVVEAALRPRRLAEFPGQVRVRDQLGL
ncbi:MAG: Holliday junction branch migration DNA helicase RuvB, partial [Dermatophilaceae bacterium]